MPSSTVLFDFVGEIDTMPKLTQNLPKYCRFSGDLVQRLFHPHKIRGQTAKPVKNDAHFQGMKQQKT